MVRRRLEVLRSSSVGVSLTSCGYQRIACYETVMKKGTSEPWSCSKRFGSTTDSTSGSSRCGKAVMENTLLFFAGIMGACRGISHSSSVQCHHQISSFVEHCCSITTHGSSNYHNRASSHCKLEGCWGDNTIDTALGLASADTSHQFNKMTALSTMSIAIAIEWKISTIYLDGVLNMPVSRTRCTHQTNGHLCRSVGREYLLARS